MVLKNLWVGHADSKNSPDFWESYMLENSLFSITGRAALNPFVDGPQPGDLIILNRNLGAKGGFIALSTVEKSATPAKQYDICGNEPQYIRKIAVEPWLRLDAPISPAEIRARLGRDPGLHRTLTGIGSPGDWELLSLFFEKKFRAIPS
jgi:hypothetical protein